MSPVLIAPHIKKSTEILHGGNCFSWLREVSWDQEKPSTKICAWLHGLRLHQNHIHIVHLPASLEQSHRAVWAAVSWAALLILPQIHFTLLVLCIFLVDKKQGTCAYTQKTGLHTLGVKSGCSLWGVTSCLTLGPLWWTAFTSLLYLKRLTKMTLTGAQPRT